MKKLLKTLSEKAIELGETEDFTKEQIAQQWLGAAPATAAQIEAAERRLGIELPVDYKAFLAITNGLYAPTIVEPTFEDIRKIEYLKRINAAIIEAYSVTGIEDIGEQLARSIVVAGIEDEQYFLLIPPEIIGADWKYWKFANWIPAEEAYEGLEAYFKEVLADIEAELEEG